MATLEMIPILIIVVLLINFSFGFFGVTHSAILQSIASRNYAFETFRYRANLTYFHPLSDRLSNDKTQVRLHGIVSEAKGAKDSNEFIAATRLIDFFTFAQGRATEVEGATNSGLHVNKIQELNENRRNETVGANPVWIKTVYGICLNSTCKPEK